MSKKPIFTQILILIAIILVCAFLTITLALVAGSVDSLIFDFSSLNFANVIPVFIIGGVVTCIIVGIAVLFVSRSAFFKVRDFIFDKKDDNGGNES